MRRTLWPICLLPLLHAGCFDPQRVAGTNDEAEGTGTSGPASSTGSTSGPETTATPPSSSVSGTSAPLPTTGGETGTDTSASDPSGPPGSSSEDSGDASDSEMGTSSGGCVQDCSGIACGQDPVCLLDCPAQCGPTATCSDDQSYCGIALGSPDHLGTDADVVGDVIFGHRVTVPANTTLKALGVIAGAAGPNVQLALYSDSSGPQTRMRQSGEFALVNDDNRIEVPDTALTAGDYWIMMHTEGLTSLGRTAADDNDHEFAYVFEAYPDDGSNSFPLTLDGDAIVEDYRYNLYIIVEE